MVRRYERKSSRAAYSNEALQSALEALRNGATVREIARSFGISAKTLRRHRDGKVLMPGQVRMGNRKKVFTDEQERELVLHIQSMEKALFGLTKHNIRG